MCNMSRRSAPLTASYFNMWAFFDLQFGFNRETMETCILRVTESTGVLAESPTSSSHTSSGRRGTGLPTCSGLSQPKSVDAVRFSTVELKH